MSNIFFTSDVHWGHFNLWNSFQPARRQTWRSVEEMDEGLIANWNSVVGKNDDVYNLGDVFFTSDLDRIDDILSRLNGRHHLIFGNHDQVLKMNRERFAKHFVWMRDYFEMRVPRPGTQKDDTIVMFHFPMAVWNKMHHGAVHIHGHCHGHYMDAMNNRVVDVGIDSAMVTGRLDMRPFSLDEVRKCMANRSFTAVDGHGK